MARNKDKELKNSPGHSVVPDVIPEKEPEKELPKPDKIKVEIVGSVFNGKEYLKGVVEMDYNSAMKLLDSGHVKPVEE